MVAKAVAFSLFLSCCVQVSEMGEPEVLPTPPASSRGEAAATTFHPPTIPYPNPEMGRRLSARLEVASSIVRGHFRARIGKGHPATWLADSVRRKADQLEHGFIDRVPHELLTRNMIQIHSEVDELLTHVALFQLAHVQRHVPDQLRKMERSRDELAAMLGLQLGLETE
jgi:hypothetical protein